MSLIMWEHSDHLSCQWDKPDPCRVFLSTSVSSKSEGTRGDPLLLFQRRGSAGSARCH